MDHRNVDDSGGLVSASSDLADVGWVDIEVFGEPGSPLVDELLAIHYDEGRRPVGAEPFAGDSAEIARQLANLSPRAAKAVAAAAKATTEEEREAALAAIEAEDETINRGLLLKFLGSVDG